MRVNVIVDDIVRLDAKLLIIIIIIDKQLIIPMFISVAPAKSRV